MEKVKQRWDITERWQYLFPILGVVLMVITAYIISRRLVHLFNLNNTWSEWVFTIAVGCTLYIVMLKVFLWCFKKLAHKWPVAQRWEM
ncbi:MAG: prolipoprotein diacylglyceryl transferase, partial [Bacteroidota bacterium]